MIIGKLEMGLNSVNAWAIKILLVLVVMVVICLWSFDLFLCENKLIGEKISHNEEYVASIFKRSCGASTADIMIIGIRLSNEKFEPDNYNNWVFTIQGNTDINVSWIEDNKLNIKYNVTSNQLTKKRKWRDTNITYLEIYH